MNKTTLWMLVAILVICGAATVRAQYPGPFLTDEIRPNGILFLPVPPDNVKDSIGGKFYNDWWYYQWGKSVRDDYSITPDKDEELAREWGYPSGHSARGWMFAYVLSQIAPDRANDLALRAYAYAMNRVVFGHHLKSDIDAGQMLAAVISDLPLSSDKFENVNNN